MSSSLRRVLVLLFRLVVITLVNALALYLTSLVVPGMNFLSVDGRSPFISAIAAAILLGLVNLFLRPVILLLARPLGFFALFAIGFLVNVVVLSITAWLLPSFELQGFVSALIAGILFASINMFLSGVLELNDDDSFYHTRIEREAARSPFPTAGEPGRGLVMMEIDGLSYHHVKKAIEDGTMPFMRHLLTEEGYRLSLIDCGIPSQTSACQAGIMFGNNDDIPAFRWYDKDAQKLIVSSKNAGELNARYANGNGLMRGGSSIDNMLNGDAYKSIITAADLFIKNDKEQLELRARDVYLLMLHPTFLMRTIVLYLVMVVRELWQGFQQWRHKVVPRLNRLEHGYPFVRAATSVIMRDLGAGFTLLDIARGSPSIYVTWPGYDEVAHHSGPWTSDAMGELERYDRVIARIYRACTERAPRPYDLIVLSDHGQSFGQTFKQRYGLTIKEFIEQHLPAGTSVTAAIGGDTGAVSLQSVGRELDNVASAGVGSATGRRVARQSKKLVDRALIEEQARAAAAERPAEVTAFGSGNLAQVYFDLFPRKITLTELNAAYPGMVDALVGHEGIGLVCGYLDDGTPVAIGKEGRRNLHTGEVTGVDPMLPYAPESGPGAATVEKRVWQVRRVMDFPHAGDLMLISTVYPDGTVAALEELIGSHGGIGGEQTDAFIFHPPDMAVPDTRNSTDVYHVLNGHRGSPIPPKAPASPPPPEIDDWSPSAILRGLALVGIWLAHATRCIIPDRDAFARVFKDRQMLGPALLMALVTIFLQNYFRSDGSFNRFELLANLLLWPFTVAMMFLAARAMGGTGSFTDSARVLGFARTPYLLLVLAFIPQLAPAVRIITAVMVLVGNLFGMAVAHNLRGWRALLLPLIAVLVTVVGLFAIQAFLSGVELTFQGILEVLGLQPAP
jgi:uncharacterized membrane protein YvlD (DUF360 family)